MSHFIMPVETLGIVFLAPIPLAVIALIAAAGATTAVVVFKHARRQRISLLGPRKSGKSTLFTLLTGGTITKEYVATQGRNKADGEIRMEDLKLKVEVNDVGGSKESYHDWFEVSGDAKVLVYVFNAARIKTDLDYSQLAVKGARHVRSWQESGDVRTDVRIVLVGTHRDQDQERSRSDYEDTTQRYEAIKTIVETLHPRRTLLVDLHSREGSNQVLWAIADEAGQ